MALTLGLTMLAQEVRASFVVHPRPTADQLQRRGDTAGAARALRRDYHLTDPTGLLMLHRLSLMVLRESIVKADPIERVQAAITLTAERDVVGYRVILGALRSPDVLLQVTAVDGLADMGDLAGIEMLRLLFHSDSLHLRELALNGLGQLNDPMAKAELLSALNDPLKASRLTAARALARQGAIEARPKLRELWLQSEDASERVLLAGWLLQLGDNLGLADLRTQLASGAMIDRRTGAAMALADATYPEVIADLHRALQDPATEVRIAAAVALTRHGDSSGIGELRQALHTDNRYIRSELGRRLEKIDVTLGHEFLVEAAESEDPDLRMASIRTLGLQAQTRDVDILTGLFNKEGESSVRAYIAWALGRIGTEACVEPLLAMLADPSPALRLAAAEAIDRVTRHLLSQSSGVGGM